MTSQKHLFTLDPEWHYINCAYMSPLLKAVEDAGIEGMRRKRTPHSIGPADFFEDSETVRQLFGRLVNAEPGRVAIIPSVSYGLAVVVQNCKPKKGGRVVTVFEEFPSDIYALHRLCADHELELVTVEPPDEPENRGRMWNQRILEAIVPGVELVNLSSVHWADGTLFDLEAIGKRARQVGAMFVVDGTQSVGAMEMNVKRFYIDALICAGYKWLLGPYTSGFAYYSERFDGGRPLEESWLNRLGSDNFRELVNYQPEYYPGAGRYNMGEHSNFIHLPMLKASLTQILEWTPAAITDYCKELSAPLLEYLQQSGFWVEEEAWRAGHIFGFRLPAQVSLPKLQQSLADRKVVVSLRGSAVRVSPHLYNDEEDMNRLVEGIQLNN